MQHMGQKHGGQQLLPESVGLLRRLDRATCVVCGTTRSQRCNRCGLCQSITPLRELRVGVGDSFQDRRKPGHQSAAPGVRPPITHLLRARSQCLQLTLLTTARYQTAPFGILSSQSETSSCSLSSAEPRDGTPAMRGLSIRHGMGRKPRRSHEQSPVPGLALPLQVPPAPP